MELANKTVLITGGSSGIGLEIVKQLSRENKVIVVAHRKTLETDMQGISSKIHSFNCDLSNRNSVEDIFDKIGKQFSSIDVLINNAAVQYPAEFLDNEFSLQNMEREIEINFVSLFKITYLLLPSLLKQTPSFILNVNSGLGLAPKRSSAVYCATKFGLNGFSKSLAYQLKDTNIKVLQAFMPLVDTPMTEGRGAGKISAVCAAERLIEGLSKEKPVNNIGKVKLLRLLLRLSPSLAEKIMSQG